MENPKVQLTPTFCASWPHSSLAVVAESAYNVFVLPSMKVIGKIRGFFDFVAWGLVGYFGLEIVENFFKDYWNDMKLLNVIMTSSEYISTNNFRHFQNFIIIYILAIQANLAVDVYFHFVLFLEDVLHNMAHNQADHREWNFSDTCTTEEMRKSTSVSISITVKMYIDTS